MLALLLAGAVALAAQDATLRTTDGIKLHARVEKPAGATKGVVLVHMLGRDATDLDYVGEKLARAGLASVAPDLRGHGTSDKAGATLTDADYLAMVYDVRASVAWLRANGVQEVSCLGGSIGANLCLAVAAEDAAMVNVVMLSPGLNYKGITAPQALKGYGNRPLLLVASETDTASARAATLLEERALGQVHLELYPDAGHGTKMLNREASLESLVQSWLIGTFQLGSGEVVVPRPAMGVDGDTMDTEGSKLQSHE